MMNNINPIIPSLFPQSQVISGFSTRHGGVSAPPFNTLNFGYDTEDDRSNVRDNHAIFYRFLNVDRADVALMEQEHGNRVRMIDSGGVYPGIDGMITSTPGIMLSVRVADCIPLLLFDPVKKIIGTVHCGWRSLLGGIAEKTLKMMKLYRSVAAENVLAVLGPSAGQCCYEIGQDLAERLKPEFVETRNNHLFGNLKGELICRLLNAGVKKHQIESISDCTICTESLYFSYRRDGVMSGRMMGYILLM